MRLFLLRRERRQRQLTLAQAKCSEQCFYQLSQSLNLTPARHCEWELTLRTTLGKSSGDPGSIVRPQQGQFSPKPQPRFACPDQRRQKRPSLGAGSQHNSLGFHILRRSLRPVRDPRQCAFDHSTIMLISLSFQRVCACFVSI